MNKETKSGQTHAPTRHMEQLCRYQTQNQAQLLEDDDDFEEFEIDENDADVEMEEEGDKK